MERTMPIAAFRRNNLGALPYDELKDHWRELAVLLAAKVDPATGELPPAYARRYEAVRAEFARRGEQLSLWTS